MLINKVIIFDTKQERIVQGGLSNSWPAPINKNPLSVKCTKFQKEKFIGLLVFVSFYIF